jgi:hypothetical protein
MKTLNEIFEASNIEAKTLNEIVNEKWGISLIAEGYFRCWDNKIIKEIHSIETKNSYIVFLKYEGSSQIDPSGYYKIIIEKNGEIWDSEKLSGNRVINFLGGVTK